MLSYLILVCILFVLFVLSEYKWPYKWQNKLLIFVPCIVLFCFSVLRFDVGFDYPAYYEAYFEPEESERYEPLSYVLLLIAQFMGEPYFIFIVYGIPIYFLAFWACYKTNHFQIAFWSFVFLFLFSTFGAIRQAVALSIVLCALWYMQQKKMFIYIILCLIASLFHITALIMLPTYFVYHYGKWKYVILAMCGISLLFNHLIILLLENNLYVSYFFTSEGFEGGNFIRLFYIFLYLLLLLLSYIYNSYNETKHLFVAMIPGFFFPFLLGGHLGGRIASYFYLGFIYLLPAVLSKSSTKIRMAVMILLCFFFFSILYVSTNNAIKTPYTPYKTIFEVDWEYPIFK